MSRIPPSARIRQEIQDLLAAGASHDDPRSALIRLAAQLIGQQILEEEASSFLEREHYQRRDPDEPHRGYRNGYRTRKLDSAEGRIELEVPQLRDTLAPFRSELADLVTGRSEVLEDLAVQMYTRGMSVRDIEDALREINGEALLTRTAVSRLSDRIWDDYQAFCQRDLSEFPLEYLFLDGVYESMRARRGPKEGILVAWGICADGRKVLLHMALGSRESYEAWRDFLRDMLARGLQHPAMYTTDGAPGLIRACEECLPKSRRQRCLAHKVRNVTQKVPDSARQEVKEAVRSAYYAATRPIAEAVAQTVIAQYESTYPGAMASFQDDLEACWAYLDFPVIHHKRIRTTNLAERAIQEQRRRTKVIPRFFGEKSCIKLAFAALWQASQRWQAVRMSDIEQAQLARIRKDLGLTPIDLEPDDRTKRPTATQEKPSRRSFYSKTGT